jgi:hypothetical protein
VTRRLVSQRTIEAIASEIADVPLASEACQDHHSTLIPLLEGIDKLRALPLKEVEPAVVFSPIED